MKLVETADVFLTNYLPPVRRKLEDRHRRRPGPQPEHHLSPAARAAARRGPTPRRAATTAPRSGPAAAWASTMPETADGWPPGQPSPAFGDVMGGLTTAGGIAAALVKRERTGEASVVDVLAARHRHVAAVADGHRLEAVRVLEDPAGRPGAQRQPARRHLPHGRRPLHLPDPPAVRQALGRLCASARASPRWPTDPALRRLGRPGRERGGVRRRRSTRRSRASRWRTGPRRSTASRACGARSRPSTSSTTTRR